MSDAVIKNSRSQGMTVLLLALLFNEKLDFPP